MRLSSLIRPSALVATALLFLAAPGHTASPVYVPLGSGNAVAMIDAAEDEVVATIPEVPNAHGLAATPDGTRLVAGSLVARKADTPPPRPEGMEESEHRTHHSGSGEKPREGKRGILYLIDTKERRIRHQVPVPAAIHHNAVTPDGDYAISTHPATGTISMVDLNRRELLKEVATGPVPNYAVTSPSGDRVFVSNTGNNTVSVVDTEYWIVRRNLLAGKGPEHLALAPSGETLYVATVEAGTVSVIDLGRGAVTRTFEVGAQPHGVDISPDGGTLYVTSKGDNRLVPVDLASGHRRSRDLAPAPHHLTTVGDTGKLYVSSRQQPKIWGVDADNLEITGTIAIEGCAHQMAVVK